MALHVILWLDGLPFWRIAVGILCHLMYMTLLNSFPFMELTDMNFILSCVCVIVDHYVWFRYFYDNYYMMHEMLGFFVLNVWLVPFGFFISLSINECAMPTMDPDG